jgi:CDP-paratose 2-epimerase
MKKGTDKGRKLSGDNLAWQGSLKGIASVPAAEPLVMITGGAGFIGTNLAHRFLSSGRPVLLFDNLSRPGVQRNLNWLCEMHGDLVQIEVADIQDFSRVRAAVRRASEIYHLAAQVAVTTSLADPLYDFEVNARGTLNLLEAARELPSPPPLVYTSTNKVYGALGSVALEPRKFRYEPAVAELRENGFNEEHPLDFHSPYGCSKGAAEQYVLDYARTFGLPALVLRMSCIYGPHQFGTEDQGWVAHFLIRAIEENPITVYGDGRQVRDILFVDDLMEAMLLARQHIGRLSGQAFNMGGGPGHTVSLLELIDLIGELRAARPVVRFENWRPADQQYYVSDTRRFSASTGWNPSVAVRDGIARLYEWLVETRQRAVTPVVMQSPIAAAGGNGHRGRRQDVPKATPGVLLSRRKATKKRAWRLKAESDPGSKVIKFP